MNGFFDLLHYNEYCDKMEILAVIIQSSDESIEEEVYNFLKGNEVDTEKGKQIISQQGYYNMGQNVYQKEFLKNCLQTAVVFTILYMLLILMILLDKNENKKEKERLLYEVEKCLLEFRDNSTKHVFMKGKQSSIYRINLQLEELQDYLALLREQSRTEKEETKELVTDISHQLKTPLAALDTCFTILEDKHLSEEERIEFNTRCRIQLTVLETLLASLLQISKLEAGMMQIHIKKAFIFETLLMAVNRVYPKALNKQIEIEMEETHNMEEIEIIYDPNWICEVFVNILENAIKYSPEKSVIKISLLIRNNFIRIEIADAGIGIAKDQYHKIFQRFYRGTSEMVRQEDGSGVGLYLSREIVSRHRGTLRVSSNLGKTKEKYPGSKFIVSLPL